jgi:predicted outer membrane repeat protein
MKKIILFATILILSPLSVLASILHVPNDYPTIQAAVNAASYGDIIQLADGTYTGAGNYNVEFKGQSITIQSANGSKNCIINCRRQGRAFILKPSQGAILKGITVINGSNANSIDESCQTGGAALVMNTTIVDCVFSNNIATKTSYGEFIAGGAIDANDSVFINCLFSDNECENFDEFGSGGGAVVCHNSYFINCSFERNKSLTEAGGAALAYESYFTNCSFSYNVSEYDGGAVCSYFSSFYNCEFISNSAPTDLGGAISLFGKVSLYGSSLSSSRSTLSNCIFIKNMGAYGGAISAYSAGLDLDIINCTFTQNSSTEGGAISFYKECNAKITNCIIWNNTEPLNREIYLDSLNIQVSVTYSDISGGFTGTGNINSDPRFISSDNVKLTPNSPCIDTGTDKYRLYYDFEEFPRPLRNAYDMGAYEYHTATEVPPFISYFSAMPKSGDAALTVTFSCVAHDPNENKI